MRVITKYLGTGRSVEGDTTLIFAIDDDEELIAKMDKMKGIKSVLECFKLFSKRSLSANAYFWKLCDLIARELDTTKDEIYLRQLSRYGVFVDVKAAKFAYETLKKEYRLIEVLDDWDGWLTVRCYIGSSHYDSKEMSLLINGTVLDAKEIGVETWTEEEIRRMIEVWDPK
ncbi:MAG: hypothetical protein MJZ37_08170 [Bacilli bacterium]|nr:hypothetical protein [Bacilli bacterium]